MSDTLKQQVFVENVGGAETSVDDERPIPGLSGDGIEHEPGAGVHSVIERVVERAAVDALAVVLL
jgi:hypothetical protein